MAQQIANGDPIENKRKFVQFIVIFHLLKQGHLVMDFKGCKEFFNFLKVSNNPRKHWIDTTSWSMAKAMQDFVFQSTHLAVQKA